MLKFWTHGIIRKRKLNLAMNNGINEQNNKLRYNEIKSTIQTIKI